MTGYEKLTTNGEIKALNLIQSNKNMIKVFKYISHMLSQKKRYSFHIIYITLTTRCLLYLLIHLIPINIKQKVVKQSLVCQ